MMKTFSKEDQGVLIELSTVEQWGAGEARENIADYLCNKKFRKFFNPLVLCLNRVINCPRLAIMTMLLN